jgi:GNAT superfamily N-acetyltransferase
VHAGLTTDEAIGALEGNLWSMWRQFGQGEGCHLVDEPDLLRFETPLPHVPYNAVLRFRCDHRVDEAVDAVLATYRARSVPVVWVVHPTARPADLPHRLRAHGLEEAEVMPGMIARLESLPAPDPAPAGIEVAEVRPDEEEPFIGLVAWRYGLPPDATGVLRSVFRRAGLGEPASPTRAWVARRDGEVVSKASLHVAGGCAGVYGVATRDDARGLGLARLLTLVALAAARASGASLGVLQATPAAVGLYRALGFEAVADFRLYSPPGALHL